MDFNLYDSKSIHACWPLDIELDLGKHGRELYTKDTFLNLDSPDLEGRWGHDPTMKFASVKAATMRCFLADNIIHIIFDFDPANAMSQAVFKRMSEYDYVGCSPGFTFLDRIGGGSRYGHGSQHDSQSGQNDNVRQRNNVRHVKAKLHEWSLTERPAHPGSSAVLQGEISMKQIAKQQADHWRWLNEQKSLINNKAKTDLERYKNTSEEFRNYLNEQRKLSQALENIDTEPMSQAKIDEIKRNSPYFRSYPGMPPGYERVAFSTK